MEQEEGGRLAQHVRQVRGPMFWRLGQMDRNVFQCYNLVILLDIKKGVAMSTTPQRRALNNYRKRLNQRGMARFEVLGLDGDRDLIRSLARRLAGELRSEFTCNDVRILSTLRRMIWSRGRRLRQLF
jgi:hypothetical protein